MQRASRRAGEGIKRAASVTGEAVWHAAGMQIGPIKQGLWRPSSHVAFVDGQQSLSIQLQIRCVVESHPVSVRIPFTVNELRDFGRLQSEPSSRIWLPAN